MNDKNNAQKCVERVTPADIEAEIAAEYTFTGGSAVQGCPVHASLNLLTICVLVLRNGFTVVGKSACVDPQAFSREIGARIAREDAIDQMWQLLGFRLMDRRHAMANGPTVTLGYVSAGASAAENVHASTGPGGAKATTADGEPLTISAAVLDAAAKVRETGIELANSRGRLTIAESARTCAINERLAASEAHSHALEVLMKLAGDTSDFGN